MCEGTDKRISYEHYPIEIANEWVEKGKKETDEVFKFVSYWITFNQLYNYGISEIERESERSRIRLYCKKHAAILVDAIDFDAPFLKEFKTRPVLPGYNRVDRLDWRAGESYITEKILEEQYHDKKREDPEIKRKCRQKAREFISICDDRTHPEDRVNALFQTMYQVRSNLMHGAKNPTPERDFSLISGAAQVMDVCLPALIEDTFRRR